MPTYYVSTPRWTCCVEVEDGRITWTAPLLWATWRGKSAEQFFHTLRGWFGARLRIVQLPERDGDGP